MPLPIVPIKDNPDEITVEIFIYQHFGYYHFWLWNKEASSSEDLGEGINADDIPDIITLPYKPQELNGRIFHWKIRIATFNTPTSTLKYNVNIQFKQGTHNIHNGSIPLSGNIGENPIELEGGVRFILEQTA